MKIPWKISRSYEKNNIDAILIAPSEELQFILGHMAFVRAFTRKENDL